jgi:hypothetical protein
VSLKNPYLKERNNMLSGLKNLPAACYHWLVPLETEKFHLYTFGKSASTKSSAEAQQSESTIRKVITFALKVIGNIALITANIIHSVTTRPFHYITHLRSKNNDQTDGVELQDKSSKAAQNALPQTSEKP